MTDPEGFLSNKQPALFKGRLPFLFVQFCSPAFFSFTQAGYRQSPAQKGRT